MKFNKIYNSILESISAPTKEPLVKPAPHTVPRRHNPLRAPQPGHKPRPKASIEGDSEAQAFLSKRKKGVRK